MLVGLPDEQGEASDHAEPRGDPVGEAEQHHRVSRADLQVMIRLDDLIFEVDLGNEHFVRRMRSVEHLGLVDVAIRQIDLKRACRLHAFFGVSHQKAGGGTARCGSRTLGGDREQHRPMVNDRRTVKQRI
jgi:hypothetical protein